MSVAAAFNYFRRNLNNIKSNAEFLLIISEQKKKRWCGCDKRTLSLLQAIVCFKFEMQTISYDSWLIYDMISWENAALPLVFAPLARANVMVHKMTVKSTKHNKIILYCAQQQQKQYMHMHYAYSMRTRETLWKCNHNLFMIIIE